MAVAATVNVVQSAIFNPRDLRDPLGVWGFRLAITGTASGGSLKATAQIPADRKAAYVYTAYSCQMVLTTGTAADQNMKMRLLSNWPNIDPQAGVQGYSSAIFINTNGADGDFTSPNSGPQIAMVTPLDRFILLYDPRPIGGAMSIMELEVGSNVLNDVWAFEGYGYFWDRQVLDTPGGLRHPGSD